MQLKEDAAAATTAAIFFVVADIKSSKLRER